MKIKHYKAPDMRTALRQVKDAQGPDAVILSSRRIAGGVEVVAAVDYDGEEAMTEQLAQGVAPASRYAAAEERAPQASQYAPAVAQGANRFAAAEERSRNVSFSGGSQLSGCPFAAS